MIAALCPEHGREILLSMGRIRSLTTLDVGVLALEPLECYDGQRLIVLTGNRLNDGQQPTL